MRTHFRLFLIPVSLLVLAFLAQRTIRRAWEAFIHYETPYGFSNPAAHSSPAMVDHVYMLLVDGLGLDPSREMRFLNELRTRGADFSCMVGLPSLSLPGRAVLLTGAWQEVNGQLTNFNARRLPIETLFQVSKKRNLTTALAAGKNVHKMLDPFIDEKIVYPGSSMHKASQDFSRYEHDLHQAAAATRELLRTKHPNLFFFEYTITDDVAHDFRSDSEQYAAAVRQVDEEIRRLAAEIDFSNSVLVVTSDHGHVARGGHGGSEPEVLTVPLVMMGKGILPGTVALARQIDVAPTVAALLGTEIPADNQGRTLADAFEVDDAAKTLLLENLYQQKQSFTQQYLNIVNGLSGKIRTPKPTSLSVASLETALDHLDAEADQAKQARVAQEPGARLGWVLSLMLLPGIALGWTRWKKWIKSGDLALGLLAIIIYWAVYFLLFSAAHMAYSFTAVNVEEKLGEYFGKDMIFAGVGIVISSAVVSGLFRRTSSSSSSSLRNWDLLRVCYVAVALVSYSLLLKISVAYWRHGLFARWYVPDMHWGFGIYLDLLQLMILGFVAWVTPLAGWLGWKMIPRVSSGGRS